VHPHSQLGLLALTAGALAAGAVLTAGAALTAGALAAGTALTLYLRLYYQHLQLELYYQHFQLGMYQVLVLRLHKLLEL
jgi:hypothetical protein